MTLREGHIQQGAEDDYHKQREEPDGKEGMPGSSNREIHNFDSSSPRFSDKMLLQG